MHSVQLTASISWTYLPGQISRPFSLLVISRSSILVCSLSTREDRHWEIRCKTPRWLYFKIWSCVLEEQEATSFLSSSSLWAKAITEKSIQDAKTHCGFRSYLGQNPSLATLENLKLRLGRAGSNFLPFFLIIRSKSKKKKSIQDTETQCGFGPYRGRMNPKAKSTALYTRPYMAPNRVDIQ